MQAITKSESANISKHDNNNSNNMDNCNKLQTKKIKMHDVLMKILCYGTNNANKQ